MCIIGALMKLQGKIVPGKSDDAGEKAPGVAEDPQKITEGTFGKIWRALGIKK